MRDWNGLRRGLIIALRAKEKVAEVSLQLAGQALFLFPVRIASVSGNVHAAVTNSLSRDLRKTLLTPARVVTVIMVLMVPQWLILMTAFVKTSREGVLASRLGVFTAAVAGRGLLLIAADDKETASRLLDLEPAIVTSFSGEDVSGKEIVLADPGAVYELVSDVGEWQKILK